MLHAGGTTTPSVIVPGMFTVDTLPDPAANLDLYARVTDLFGVKRDLVLASQDNHGAYWQPVRPVYKGIQNITSDTDLICLKTPSVLSITGSVMAGVTRKLKLRTQFVYPGAMFTVRNRLSNMLGTLQVTDETNLVLSSLALNNSYTYYYDADNGWELF